MSVSFIKRVYPKVMAVDKRVLCGLASAHVRVATLRELEYLILNTRADAYTTRFDLDDLPIRAYDAIIAHLDSMQDLSIEIIDPVSCTKKQQGTYIRVYKHFADLCEGDKNDYKDVQDHNLPPRTLVEAFCALPNAQARDIIRNAMREHRKKGPSDKDAQILDACPSFFGRQPYKSP